MTLAVVFVWKRPAPRTPKPARPMDTYFRRFDSRLLLIGTAIFAGLWAVARACTQSVTIDEADTYLDWVARTSPGHWEAASNNHVLNSLLMRLFTSLFGLSHLTLRAPALIGAAIYISAAYVFCRILTNDTVLQWLVFVCLVYNPFLFDYLVAARGYSLAMAFLMATLVIAAGAQSRWPPERIAAACSICAALSFAGNFSFGFVDGAAMLAIFLWLCPVAQASWPVLGCLRQRLRLAAACTIPGLIVTLFLTASVVAHFSKSELSYGARSLGEMWRSVVRDSLYQLNPQMVNPFLLNVADRCKHFLFPLLAAFAVWRAVAAARGTRVAPDPHALWLRQLGCMLGATLALALLTHWIAFQRWGVLLPMDRTALFLALLATMSIGVAAALPGASHDWGRRGLTTMLFAVSLYFLGCLRLGYFKEWQWDAEVNRVYPVLAYYNRTYGIGNFVSEWKYGSALRLYHRLYGRDSISEIRSPLEIPEDGAVYVLDWGYEQDVIKRLGLRVVYRGAITEVVVAIRPEVESGVRCVAGN